METDEAVRRRRRVYALLLVLALVALALVAWRLRPNTPPVVLRITASATVVDVADEVNLSVAFRDPDGDSHDVTWDFGDGKTGEGADVTTSWDAPGRYLVTVLVDDRRGGVAVSGVPTFVLVNPLTPATPSNVSRSASVAHAEFQAPMNVTFGQEVAFDASASGEWNWTPGSPGQWVLRHDPSLVLLWTWDFGDGETLTANTTAGASASHVYLSPGYYFAKLTVELPNRTRASWGMTVRTFS